MSLHSWKAPQDGKNHLQLRRFCLRLSMRGCLCASPLQGFRDGFGTPKHPKSALEEVPRVFFGRSLFFHTGLGGTSCSTLPVPGIPEPFCSRLCSLPVREGERWLLYRAPAGCQSAAGKSMPLLIECNPRKSSEGRKLEVLMEASWRAVCWAGEMLASRGNASALLERVWGRMERVRGG